MTRSGWPALRYLTRRSLANRLRELRVRLRQPRYLLGALIGVLYFGAIAVYFLRADPDELLLDDMMPAAELLAAPVLALLTIYWWLGSTSHSALAFSPSEVQFLFQAPIPRRTLVQFKLLRAQPALLAPALFLGIVLASSLEVGLLAACLSTWSLWAILHMHRVAAALTRTNWSQRKNGRHGSRLATGLFVAWAGAVLWGLGGVLPAFYGSFSWSAALLAVEGSLAHPAAAVALLPFQIVVAPLFADDLLTWLAALAANGALLAAHYLWIVQVNAAFEERAAAAGEEAATQVASIKQGRYMARELSKKGRLPVPWFPLAPSGQPGLALFWKNFLSFTRTLRPAFLLVLVALFGGLYVLLLMTEPDSANMAMVMAIGALVIYSIPLGPLMQRNDLRTDLLSSELLRTYPISGASVALAEIGASTVSIFTLQAVGLTVALVFVLLEAPELPWTGLPAVGYAVALVTLVLVNAIGVGIQNALAVWLPGWYQLGPASRGMEGLAGSVLLMIVSALGMAVCYVAPFGFAAAAAFLLWPTFGWGAVAPAAAGAWAFLAAEVVVLVVVVGRLYEDMDPVEAGVLK